MCLNATRDHRPLRRAAASYALVVATLLFWAIRLGSTADTWPVDAGVSVLAALIAYLVLPFYWLHRYPLKLRAFYSAPERQLLLGPHELLLTDTGLESIGPHHRAFREWVTVSSVSGTPSHLFLTTVFGNVYILPWRAVPERSTVLSYVTEKMGTGSNA